jgi:hypothetical protein
LNGLERRQIEQVGEEHERKSLLIRRRRFCERARP